MASSYPGWSIGQWMYFMDSKGCGAYSLMCFPENAYERSVPDCRGLRRLVWFRFPFSSNIEKKLMQLCVSIGCVLFLFLAIKYSDPECCHVPSSVSSRPLAATFRVCTLSSAPNISTISVATGASYRYFACLASTTSQSL